MPTQIQRYAPTASQQVAFGTTVEGSATLCMSAFAAFAVIVPPGTASTTIVWHASHRDEGPFYPVTLSSGAPASTAVVAGRVYIAPPELFACMYIRGVAGAAFTGIVMAKT